MKEVDIGKYAYRIEWSEEANENIATCLEFPLLRATGESPEAALKGIKELVKGTVEWIIEKNQKLPKEFYSKKHSGKTNEEIEFEDKDFLTGLYNRNYCKKIFKDYADRGLGFSFVYFDIDSFKSVNDALNYEVGDEILQYVSRSLLDALADDVYIFRFGGDEFACIVSKEVSDISVQECVDRIISIFKETIYLEKLIVDMTISLGVVYYPQNTKDVNDVFKVAELAMREAKKEQENSICFFEKELQNKLDAKILMESNLASSVRNNELFIEYQPIIHLNDSETISFEALVRWNSKVLALVSPAEFIPVAEEMGQIYNIGYWVMDKAVEKLSNLVKKSNKKVNISINISPLQLKDIAFTESVEKIIKKHSVSPDSIIFEFTESVFIENDELARKILEDIRRLGIQTAIDDFGTGYSSMTYLKDMNINYLKIDKTFIDDLGKSSRLNLLVESIINIGHNLGMIITAEGVETEEQLNILKALGCDSIQGYYFSKPLSEDNLVKYL